MKRHAEVICKNGGDILNIGFGLGIIDTFIQQHDNIKSHTIIEAHPDVYQYMIDNGWDKKKNVKIIFGRWQKVLKQLDKYDGIFFDTYSEFYEDMKMFHKVLADYLKPNGIYSYFNGLCARNLFFHDVYCWIARLDLEGFLSFVI
jgi:type IV protein arginine methyltransferase